MTGVPDEFLPDGTVVIDLHCAECGQHSDYGMSGRPDWVCPHCAGYFDDRAARDESTDRGEA